MVAKPQPQSLKQKIQIVILTDSSFRVYDYFIELSTKTNLV